MTSEWVVFCGTRGDMSQLSGLVEAGGALPQWCGVDEVSTRSAHASDAGAAQARGVWRTARGAERANRHSTKYIIWFKLAAP